MNVTNLLYLYFFNFAKTFAEMDILSLTYKRKEKKSFKSIIIIIKNSLSNVKKKRIFIKPSLQEVFNKINFLKSSKHIMQFLEIG